MSKNLLTFLICALTATGLVAQTAFQKTFGGSNSEEAGNMIQTSTGYAIVGGSISTDTQTWDIILISMNNNGDTLRSKLFSNIEIEKQANDPLNQIGIDLVETGDGDFIIVGTIDGEIEGNQTRGVDIIALRYDPNTDVIEWESVIRRDNFLDEVPTSACLSTDGSRVYVAGYGYNLAQGMNRDTKSDGFVMSVDANSGQHQWTKAINNTDNDYMDVVYDVSAATDGGVYLCGVTSRNHISYGFTLSDLDLATSFLGKLNSGGNQEWIKEIEVPNNRNYSHIAVQALGITTTTTGFAVTGGISYNQESDASLEAMILEATDNGTITSVRSFNGNNKNVYGTSIIESTDGFVISGAITETGDEVRDIYLAGTNAAGDVIWSSNIGGQGDETPVGLANTTSGYMVVATTKSFTVGGKDLYVAQTNKTGTGLECNVQEIADDRLFSLILPDQFTEGNSVNISNLNGAFQTEVDKYGGMNTGAITFTGACTCSSDADFESSAPACKGVDIDFISKNSGSGLSYTWDFGGNATPATFDGANPTDIQFSTTGLHLVTLTVGNSTCSSTITKSIEIRETPEVVFTVPTSICEGGIVNFAAPINTISGDWRYDWSLGLGATPISSTAEAPQNVVYSTAGLVTVSLTIYDQYCSASASETFTVLDLPNPAVIENQSICANRCIEIGGTEITGTTYEWSTTSGTLSDVNVSNPEACPEHSTTTYLVKATDGNTCSYTDTVVITMLDPAVANAGQNASICVGETEQIGAGYVEGQTYSWSPATGLSDVSVPSPVANPTETTTYTLSAGLYGCETVSDQVTITVNPLPTVVATTIDGLDTVEIALNESVQLIAGGAHEYAWDNFQSLNAEGIYNPLAKPLATTTYTVTGTDVKGCANTDSVLVIVNIPSTWVPNVFTPNNDGNNDYFFVRTQGVSEFDFSVLTRNGESVFHTNDPAIGWDGTKLGTGKELPQGAYVYTFTTTLTNGEVVSKRGIVNLVR